ncbi:MAG TPA: nuclear transport factor 2 family protein [Acidobacteriaceae bacterium]|nr:nuclear transport factor 2 family protein [Acidobacteriaceae bacterium]
MTSALIPPTIPALASLRPAELVRCTLSALNRRDIPAATASFGDRFTFVDHAVGFTFMAKEQLADFFQKAINVLQESLIDVESTAECGGHVIARWTLRGIATQELGALAHRQRVCVTGVSIAEVTDGAIASWADFYDASRSWRFSLVGSYANY